ncbi:outer membrane protein [Rhizobium sp. LjRoot254]|uniref:outer membrane protein n=1 Tax=Rhizobium sp. LjRoot254 TaxID=3342297 RepID=UPI003ECCF2E2
MKLPALAFGLLASLTAGPSLADEYLASDRFFIIPNVSTLGAGIEAGYRWNDNWQVRAGISGFSTSYVYHDRKSDLPSTLTLLNGGVTVDYFPFAGDFYVSGGVRLSANKIEGKVKNMEAKMGGSKVTVDDPLTDFTVRQNVIQPYIGAGYSVPINERVSLNFDLGALYAGTPSLSYNSRATELGFTRDQIRDQAERARNRIAPFKVYPVVQVGLKIQF